MAFHLYRFGWRTFVAINLVAYIPVTIVTLVGSYATFGSIADWQSRVIGDGLAFPDAAQAMAAFPWSDFGILMLAGFLVGPITTLGGAALIDAISSAISGGRLSARKSWHAALGRLRSLVGLYLLLAIPTVAGGLLGVAVPLLRVMPGAFGITGGPVALLGLIVFVVVLFAVIYVLIRVSLAQQALMIENLSTADALRRSWSLIDSSMLRLVGWALLFGLIVGLIGILIGVTAAFVAGIVALMVEHPTLSSLANPAGLGTFSLTFALVDTLISTIMGSLISPIATIGLTFLYFDLRRRRGDEVPVPGQAAQAQRT